MTMLTKTPAMYQPKMPRWVHQNKALHAIDGAEGFALFMEMRTGKTKTILDEWGQDEAAGKINDLLVIAPGGVFRTWEADAKKHLSDDLLAHVRIATWESGPTATEQHRLDTFMAYEGPRILLVNVEALSTKTGAAEVCERFLKGGTVTMVIDESTVIKNPTAKRTKLCLKLGTLAAKRRILSGLPSPQSPLDVYAQFKFLGVPLLEKFDQFQSRYAIIQKKPFGPGGRLIPIVVGYQNLDELQARIAPYSFRVRLADCYDLPERMYIRREVEMTPEQEVAYDQMVEFAVAELEAAERVTATIVLTQMLRLHQILCGVTMSDAGVEVDIAENRTTEMMEILENTDGKAIIWAAYGANVKRITDMILAKYGPLSVARFWGGNEKTREAEEKLFKTNPKCRFMVATAAAGGRGRTWDMADTIIYYSNTFSLEHRMQSEERAQAVGKTQSVGVFDLITPHTVEEKIIDTLRAKMELSNAITGDDWKQWIF
jgi:SNF2 family DNA or RNA helicase